MRSRCSQLIICMHAGQQLGRQLGRPIPLVHTRNQHASAEYSRTFMRLACHYLESKSIHPVDASELPAGSGADSEPATSDASSATRTDSDEVQSVGPERVRARTLVTVPSCQVAAKQAAQPVTHLGALACSRMWVADRQG